MAKLTRSVLGSVCKPKDESKPYYIKVRKDVQLKEGQILRLESKELQLGNIEKAVNSGKLSADLAEEITQRINKIPDFVMFEVVDLREAE